MRISDWSSGVCSSDLFALCWIGHQQRRQFSLVAPIGALAVLMFAAAIALPTPQAIARVEASQSHKPFSEKELARLRNEDTPVFVDFTADWCLTCKEIGRAHV